MYHGGLSAPSQHLLLPKFAIDQDFVYEKIVVVAEIALDKLQSHLWHLTKMISLDFFCCLCTIRHTVYTRR